MTNNRKTEPRKQETAGSTAQAAHADTIVPGIQRNYKDRLFRMIFSEKKELLNLYNAVNGTSYTNEDELQIVTLDNAVYMNMKNDLAFVIDFYMNLYEQQSTYCPNMPLRNLQYISRELESWLKGRSLYVSRLVKIPTPRFIVFYNGTTDQPEQNVLKLSDAFLQPTDNPELELKVLMLNINLGNNRDLFERCQTLKEYMQYVEKVRSYVRTMPVANAVQRTVDECIREGILSEFLSKNKREAIQVSIFEYDEEDVLRQIREDEFAQGEEYGVRKGVEQGVEQGVKQGVKQGRTLATVENTLELLEDLAPVDDSLKDLIQSQTDLTLLKKWHKLAARADSIEAFKEQIQAK